MLQDIKSRKETKLLEKQQYNNIFYTFKFSLLQNVYIGQMQMHKFMDWKVFVQQSLYPRAA